MEFQSRGIKVEDEPGGKRRGTAEEWTANKKRALSSMSDSPVAANGVADDSRKDVKPNDEEVGPQEEDEIEVCGAWIGGASAFSFRVMFVFGVEDLSGTLQRFRKAAIFRRMRYYQRDYHRAVKQYEKLEHSYNGCVLAKTEAEACWQSVCTLFSMFHYI